MILQVTLVLCLIIAMSHQLLRITELINTDKSAASIGLIRLYFLAAVEMTTIIIQDLVQPLMLSRGELWTVTLNGITATSISFLWYAFANLYIKRQRDANQLVINLTFSLVIPIWIKLFVLLATK